MNGLLGTFVAYVLMWQPPNHSGIMYLPPSQ